MMLSVEFLFPGDGMGGGMDAHQMDEIWAWVRALAYR